MYVDSGISQGTVLGPLLFLCHINDLPLSVDSKIRLFADDCLIYREITSIEDKVQLQKDLDSLQDWAENWGMRFNAQKCYILSTATARKQTPYFYQLNGEILQSVLHIWVLRCGQGWGRLQKPGCDYDYSAHKIIDYDYSGD